MRSLGGRLRDAHSGTPPPHPEATLPMRAWSRGRKVRGRAGCSARRGSCSPPSTPPPSSVEKKEKEEDEESLVDVVEVVMVVVIACLGVVCVGVHEEGGGSSG